MIESIITLNQAISKISSLASENDADLSTSIILEERGAWLIVHWTQELPRESHLFFSADDIGFLWAYCFDPGSYMRGLDEGLTDRQAEDQSRRIVSDINEVFNYLVGKKFEHYVRNAAN